MNNVRDNIAEIFDSNSSKYARKQKKAAAVYTGDGAHLTDTPFKSVICSVS